MKQSSLPLILLVILVGSAFSADVDESDSSSSTTTTESSTTMKATPESSLKSPTPRSFGLFGGLLSILLSPLAFLAALSLPGLIKISLLLVALVWFVFNFFPTLGGLFGFGLPLARQANLVYENLHHYGSTLASYGGNLSNQTLAQLNLTTPDCRQRAICDTSYYLANHLPSVNSYLTSVSNIFLLNMQSQYSQAWLNGMMKRDCGSLYSGCPKSPFKSISERLRATASQYTADGLASTPASAKKGPSTQAPNQEESDHMNQESDHNN